jgi:hypothetical protein
MQELPISKSFGSLVFNSLLFLSVISAHIAAGGGFEFTYQLVALFVMSFIFFSITPWMQMQGPGFASILVIFQFAGHMTLPIDSGVSNNQMSLTHLLAGVATYWFGKVFEVALVGMAEILSLIIFIPRLKPLQAIEYPRTPTNYFTKIQIKFFLYGISSGRAPPTSK